MVRLSGDVWPFGDNVTLVVGFIVVFYFGFVVGFLVKGGYL